MEYRNTDISYGMVSKTIHWLTAIIIISLLSAGFFMKGVPEAYKGLVYMLHKSFGLLVMALTLFRIGWHVYSRVPALPLSVDNLTRKLAKAGHHLLYLLLVLMPLSGFVMSLASQRYPVFFNLFTVSIPQFPANKSLAMWMNKTHYVLAWLFITVVFLHIAAALRHRYICQDSVFERMACRK